MTDTVKKTKYAARINGEFDALLYIVSVVHDGFTFYFGTGLVTTDFHRWFTEAIIKANAQDEGFEGRVCISLEDGRIGRALISHVGRCEEAGSKISFVIQGGLVSKQNQENTK